MVYANGLFFLPLPPSLVCSTEGMYCFALEVVVLLLEKEVLLSNIIIAATRRLLLPKLASAAVLDISSPSCAVMHVLYCFEGVITVLWPLLFYTSINTESYLQILPDSEREGTIFSCFFFCNEALLISNN